MAQQIVIIGLGHFGMSLAKRLSEKGAEVLAIDINKQRVEEAAVWAAEALVLDATDELEVAKLELKKRDFALCTIGEKYKDSSIICTALLRQSGVPQVIARASDRMHRRILKLVGAHQVVDPEQEYGNRLANKLVYKNIILDDGTDSDLQLTEINILPYMVGKSLIELELPKRFEVMVAGVRRGVNHQMYRPDPAEPLQENDILIIISSEASIPKLIKGV
jgi:trk system potassium uptake protein TrkA